MRKIIYGIVVALILISVILACTNPSLQDFTDYTHKMHGFDHAPNENILRENYFLFSSYRRSGGIKINKDFWEGYTYEYIGIFGTFYQYSAISVN